MSSIEIRITAITSADCRPDFKESSAYFVDAFSAVSAAGILNQLREMSAIKEYVLENNIPTNADRLPTIISPLNKGGEFSISLPSSEDGNQMFVVKIINRH